MAESTVNVWEKICKVLAPISVISISFKALWPSSVLRKSRINNDLLISSQFALAVIHRGARHDR